MKLLEERILKDGHILGDNILKVDSFLTHQVDYRLMREIGKVFAEKFASAGITKVVTIWRMNCMISTRKLRDNVTSFFAFCRLVCLMRPQKPLILLTFIAPH